jgi:hypothetical protein
MLPCAAYSTTAMITPDITIQSFESLNRTQRFGLTNIQMDSMLIDLPERTEQEMYHFIANVHRPIKQVNEAARHTKGPGRYDHQSHVIAAHRGMFVAHMSIANRVSSYKPLGAGVAERFFQKYTPTRCDIARRVAVVGHVAISTIGREILQQQQPGLTYLDQMFVQALDKRKPTQPVQCFPFVREGWLQQFLAGSGFDQDTAIRTSTTAFGPPDDVAMEPVQQWSALSAELVVRSLRQKAR